MEQRTAFSNPAESPARKDLCLLVLDGGGVRGLSMLLILKRLMEGIDPLNPPKPCDYFDMIGGTSTGGLIAVMLGRMQLSVDECIEAYSTLAPTIFTHVRHRIKLATGETQGRFDHEAMEQGIKDVLVQYRMDPESLFKSPVAEDCKTFVCATSQATGQTVVLSSYYNERRGADLLNTAKIWEAARATSAATTFFEPMTISDETFVDGATGANNPVQEIWTEAADVWGLQHGQLEENVKCLVSIGTGIPSLSAFGPGLREVAQALKSIATETEATADMFRKHHTGLFQSGKAFRFNVVRGLETIGLEETSKWGAIKAATRNYVQTEEVRVEIKKCAANLQEREWLEQMEKFILKTVEAPVSDLNDEDSLESADELQWLTHTVPYETWSERGSGILWYQVNARRVHRARKHAGASVAHSIAKKYRCSAGLKFGAGDKLARALYFQCDKAEQPDFQSPDGNGDGPQDILWSLICQLLMIDCQSTSALKRRLVQLEPQHKSLLWERLDGRDTKLILQWSFLEDLLLSSNMPDVVAFDNVHKIDPFKRNVFLKSLVTFAERRLPSRGRKLRVMISGDPSQLEMDVEGDILTVNDRTEREECLRSLHFPEWNARRDQVADADAGTNNWIWGHEQYLLWEQAISGLLWVEGKPGSGKSVLAKTLQRRLAGASAFGLSRSSTDGSMRRPAVIRSKIPEIPMVTDWFFNSRGGEIGIAHSSFLQSIVYQLLQQHEAAFEVVTPYYRHRGCPREDPWDTKTTQSLLEAISQTGLSIVCIIDAMDEAASLMNAPKAHHAHRTRSVLFLVGSLLNKIRNSKLKFIVLSRPDPAIEMDFSGIRKRCPDTYKVVLEHENEPDIHLVIEKGLESLQETIHAYDSDEDGSSVTTNASRLEDPKDSRNSLAAKREENSFKSIRLYLRENAKGVILWVTLILGELQDQAAGGMLRFAELEETMRRLPLQLDKLYEYIVQALEDRLNNEDMDKARLAFILISGSAALDRPIRLQEMWEALAVPSDVQAALTSKVDPIIENSIHIISWKEFWRQLRRKCGPLIELVRGEGLEPGENPDDEITPNLIVQFIHRTVKDFLNQPGRTGPLHFSQTLAVDEVKDICARYLEVAFPKTETSYGPPIPARQGSSWNNNVQEYVEYLDSKSLLHFVLSVVAPHDADPYPNLGVYASIDKMVDLPWPRSQWRYIEESDIRGLVGQRHLFYPECSSHIHEARAEVIKAAVLGQAFRYACTHGRITAVKNMMELCRNYRPDYCELQEYVIGNGVLLACIEKDLLDEVKFLTRNHRHQSQYIHGTTNMPGWPIGARAHRTDLDPFIQLAVRSGSEQIVEFLFTHTDHYYARKEAVVDFAVTKDGIALHRHSDSDSDDKSSESDETPSQPEVQFDMDTLIRNESEGEEEHREIRYDLRPGTNGVTLQLNREKHSRRKDDDSGEDYIEVASRSQYGTTAKREAQMNKKQYLLLKETCLNVARQNRLAPQNHALDESRLRNVRLAVKIMLPRMPTEDDRGYAEGKIEQNAFNPFLQHYAMADLPDLRSQDTASTSSRYTAPARLLNLRLSDPQSPSSSKESVHGVEERSPRCTMNCCLVL